jgi:hypothetical protein
VTEARGRHHGAVRATSPWDGAARARWRREAEARRQRRRRGGGIAVRCEQHRRGTARCERRWRERWRCGVGVRCKMDLRLESVRDLFTVQDAEMGIGH